MMNTTEDAGTNFEESAATMTVPGKEMKDGEGTIGMTGETILTFMLPTPHNPSVPQYFFPRFLFVFTLQNLIRMQSAVEPSV